MKRLTCEMCGGNDLVKDGGLFVCQHCGCKYTVEEARKMMIEGTVDVVVDKTSEVENLVKYADREFNDGHHANAVKIYNQVLSIDPDNLYAMYNKAYAVTLLMNPDVLNFSELIKACTRMLQLAYDRNGETEEYFVFCDMMMANISKQMNTLAQVYINLYNKAAKFNINPIKGAKLKKSLHKHTQDICDFTISVMQLMLEHPSNFDNANEGFWKSLITMSQNNIIYCNTARLSVPEKYKEHENSIRNMAKSHGVNPSS